MTAASMASMSLTEVLQAESAVSAKTSSKPATIHPNIVLMICDDLGFGDLSCYGGRLQTPNLDQLAKDGTVLTHCNTAHPTCSASRAAILTGQYAYRVGVSRVYFPADKEGMKLGTPTIASVLKKQGYHTAAFGKWHLGNSGDYLPAGRGFDEYLGVPYSVDMAPLPLIDGTTTVEENTDRDLLTQRYTERAIKVIRQTKRKPFFLYMAYSFPHIPIHASPRFRGKSGHGIYGDAVMEIDWSVGEIRKAIQEEGLEDDTLFMFTSDHGPWYQGDPGRLKGRKNTDFEGGVRVPFLACWKGQLRAGKREDAFFSTMDVLPMVAHICNTELPEVHLDGVNEWAVLSEESKTLNRDGIVLYTSGDDYNVHCARQGDWKLRFGSFDAPPYVHRAYPRKSYTLSKAELYNLRSDPTESYDVASAHPELVQNLLAKVEEIMKTFPDEVQTVYAEQKKNVGSSHSSAGEWPVPASTYFPSDDYME